MWEVIWLMVIMKIPIVYLCWVVWWAIREPRPAEGAALPARVPVGPEDSGRGWRFHPHRLPRRGRPHGGPARAYPRTARAALARSRR